MHIPRPLPLPHSPRQAKCQRGGPVLVKALRTSPLRSVQIQPGQGVLDPEPAAHDLVDTGQRLALVTPIRTWPDRPPTPPPGGSQLTGAELAAGATKALGHDGLAASRGQGPAPAVRRHPDHPEPPRSRSLAPTSIKSAAASRTYSRRSRSSAVSPPPSGYLTPPAQRSRHQPSRTHVTRTIKDL